MGMYDQVNVKLNCPYCDHEIDRCFQSKDSFCQLNLVDPQLVNEFYDKCFKCKKWIEFKRDSEIPSIECRKEPYSRSEVEEMGFKLVK